MPWKEQSSLNKPAREVCGMVLGLAIECRGGVSKMHVGS